jgi:hypothetical protein
MRDRDQGMGMSHYWKPGKCGLDCGDDNHKALEIKRSEVLFMERCIEAQELEIKNAEKKLMGYRLMHAELSKEYCELCDRSA